MIKDDFIYFEHMLLYAERIMKTLEGRTRQEFDLDNDLKDLIVYRLQVIGEAARHISAQSQTRHPQVDWSDIIGLRNRLVHGYLDIDYGIVWDIVSVELPELIEELTDIVKNKE